MGMSYAVVRPKAPMRASVRRAFWCRSTLWTRPAGCSSALVAAFHGVSEIIDGPREMPEKSAVGSGAVLHTCAAWVEAAWFALL